MHEAMKTKSSHVVNLFQFHMKASYMITLWCFMYMTNWSKCYFGVSLVGHPNTMWLLHGPIWWVPLKYIGPQTQTNKKLLKFWTNLEWFTWCWTYLPTSWSINWPQPISSALELNKVQCVSDGNRNYEHHLMDPPHPLK
jgi:hypothetical protein